MKISEIFYDIVVRLFDNFHQDTSHMTRRIILYFTLLFSLCSHAIAAPLTLDESVALGLKHRPVLRASRAHISAAKIGEQMAANEYLPKVSAHYLASLRNDSSLPPGDTRYNHNMVGVSADQLIFSGSGPIQQHAIATTVTAQSELQKTITEHRIRQYITQAFIDAWILQEQAISIEQKLREHEHVVTKSQEQFSGNQINRYQLLAAQTEKETVQNNAAIYSATHTNALQGLAAALGIHTSELQEKELVTPLHLNLPIQHLKNIEYYQQLARSNRAEGKIKQKEIQQKEYEAQLEFGKHLPTLSLGGTYNHTFERNSHAPYDYSHIDLKVNWNLFDGMKATQTKSLKDAQALTKQEELNDLYLSFDREVSNAYTSVHQADRKYSTAYKKAHQAREHFILEEMRALQGIGTKITLEHARTTYEERHHESIRQLGALFMAVNALQYACGYPTELETKDTHE